MNSISIIVLTAAALSAQAAPPSNKATPIEMVVNLMKKLISQTEAEGIAEAKTYDKFACFCKSKTTAKSTSITTQQDEVDKQVALINEKVTERKMKEDEKATALKVIEQKTADLKKATIQFNKDEATWKAKEANLNQAISSAESAHKSLSNSKPTFLQTDKSEVSNMLDLAEAMDIIPSASSEAASAFLQVDPKDPAFKFHSQKILDIIEQLKDDFTKERTDASKAWTQTSDAYTAEKKGIEKTIKSKKEAVSTLEGEISGLKGVIAGARTALQSAKDTLREDSTYLQELTTRCQDQGEAWDQRTKARDGELKALNKAKGVLTSAAVAGNAQGAASKRASLAAMKQSVAPAPQKAAAVAAAAKAPEAATVVVKMPEAAKVEVEVKKPELISRAQSIALAKKALSFLQVGKSEKAQDKAMATLRTEGARLNSDMLTKLANEFLADPFVKIKKLIQGLIERLLEEAKNEATKKGMCDTELGKAEHARDARFADITSEDANLAELQAALDTLDAEIAQLTLDLDGDAAAGPKDVASLQGLIINLANVTAERQTEAAQNAVALMEAKQGSVAVNKAITTLKDYYDEAAKAKGAAFVQLSADDDASPLDAKASDQSSSGFGTKSYKGNTGSTQAIFGLLEVIASDFDRSAKKTAADEHTAHRAFIKFSQTSKADIKAKQTKKSLDLQDKTTTESAIATGIQDLTTATNLCDTALKTLEDLQAACVDSGMSYKDRVAKREAEMTALKTAVCQLDNDNEPTTEADCTNNKWTGA